MCGCEFDVHIIFCGLPFLGMSTSKGKLLAAILYPEQMLFKYDEELPVVVILLLLYAIVCFIISVIFMVCQSIFILWRIQAVPYWII